MNYIKHLNQAFLKFTADDRLNPTHVSLYIALFQEWNQNHFSRKIFINRGEIMKRAKMGATSTYHRCLKDLNNWGYLNYYPSRNPYKGSVVEMFCFIRKSGAKGILENPASEQVQARDHPNTEQVSIQDSPTGKQASVSNINTIKQKKEIKVKKPESEKEVLHFFSCNNWSKVDALKFYYHYQSIGWKKGGEAELTDWKAAARSWMLRAKEIKSSYRDQDNLKTTKVKHYGPL